MDGIDDNLLTEILLRLPPQPSSLPRASAVCKRWHGLVSDIGFFRRFRIHHRCNPPLLGFFHRSDGRFTPTPGSPNLVPPWRLSLQANTAFNYCPPVTLGCHQGLMLLYIPTRVQVRVWDPVTSKQHDIALPPRFSASMTNIVRMNGAVLRAAAHFQVVVLTAEDDEQHDTRALACVYSSETGVWGDLISTPITRGTRVCILKAAVRVGDSFYWLLGNGTFLSTGNGILQFDDSDRQRLAVIQAPVDKFLDDQVTITRAECGGLGFLVLSHFRVQLWNRKNDCNGAASWVLGRTVELDKLLPLSLEEKEWIPRVIGFAEYNNVVFIEIMSGIFMINFQSSQFKKLSGTGCICCYPFESVYAAGT